MGQSMSGRGTTQLTGWPPSLRAAGERITTQLQLLPRVDTLSLSYRYRAQAQGVDFSFVLAWHPGARALYQGDIIPFTELPKGIRMTALEVEAQAEAGGRDVGRILIGVDSMALNPHPSVYSFEVNEVSYQTVFLDAPADSARAYFEEGITLTGMQVRRIAFAVPRTRDAGRSTGQRGRTPDRSSSSWSIYGPRVNVFLGWRVGGRPYYVGGRRSDRAERPRGDEIGRSTGDGDERSDTGRGADARSDSGDEGGGRSDSGRKKNPTRGDDEDDEDEDSLLPAGGVALAAVGVAAVVGGSVGYYGTGRTPLGLMAGWVLPRGGTLLQASINGAVLGADDGREHLVVKGVGFYDLFRAPIQPALGVGALATAEGDETTVEPSISVGAALNLGRVIVTGGYDVVQQSPEFGIAINFRYRPQQEQ